MSNWLAILIFSFVGTLLALLLAGGIAFLASRSAIQWLIGRFTKRLMSERYSVNIWEMVTAITRMGPIAVVENSLRAAFGTAIERPFGTPRKVLHFDSLVFSPALLAKFPTDEGEEIDMSITIGPKAKKPLKLEIPIMAAAMGYGIGLSEKVKVAIAKGTAAVGTSTNTGEGGFLPEDRANAKFLILQYSSGHWSKEPEILRQADAIEIHIAQGATLGTASVIPADFMQGRAAQIMQVEDQDPIIIPAKHEEISKPQDLGKLVEKLRKITEGVPIGIKIAASAKLELDLEIAILAGVDFISLDGSQAGTKGAAPILEDDFALPTIFALSRAIQYLEKRGVKERISLLSGGGYTNPGQCLKALALGADGVYLGTTLLWAMTHDQVTKAVPWEPPTQLAFYPGSMADDFDVEEAAYYLENFFTSYIEEMKLGIRALGKYAVTEVDRSDLMALDEWTSKVTNIPLAHQPYEPKKK